MVYNVAPSGERPDVTPVFRKVSGVRKAPSGSRRVTLTLVREARLRPEDEVRWFLNRREERRGS